MPDKILYYNGENKILWDMGCRHHTFRGRWDDKKSYITSEMLAISGFYYLGPGDRVRCVYCNLTYNHFDDTKEIYEAHRRDSPKCEFYIATIVPGMNDYLLKTSREYREATFLLAAYEWTNPDVYKSLAAAGFYYIGPKQETCCAFCNLNYHGEYAASTHAITSPECLKTITHKIRFRKKPIEFLYSHERALMGIMGHLPDKPAMVTLKARLETFTVQAWADFPPSKHASVRKIAESGFYFVPSQKFIKCFHCSAYIGSWDFSEDIDRFHRRMVVDCLFICQKIASEKTPDPQMVAINGKTLKRLRRYICKVCYKIPSNILLLPCNHICCCTACANSLQECPVCGQAIDGTIVPFT